MIYEYWLAALNGISAGKKRMLRGHFGSAKGIFYSDKKAVRALPYLDGDEACALFEAQHKTRLDSDYELLKEKEIAFIPYFSREYPECLSNITSAPYALYVKGELPDHAKKSAAIVGARNCSAYGEKYALAYGKYLAENGVQVISGMARGIDAAGHRGALMGGGKTFAVSGCGADMYYPRENRGLAEDILKNGGGILSEFLPGTPPYPTNFPRRNRIISGLSDAVLVMEARAKSGSLITADMALEQGKDVYALPGSVETNLSLGCNRLIYQGAGILLSPETLLEDMGVKGVKKYENSLKAIKNEKILESEEKLLYSSLALYPKDVGTLIKETGIAVKDVLDTLVSLELKGYIKEVSKNYYIKTS